MAMNKHLEVIVEEDKWLDCLENVAEYSQKVFEKTLDYLTEIELDFDKPIVVNLALSNDCDVKKLNFEFRGKDKPTNVLSFANIDSEDFEASYMNDDVVELGDIVIALETTQAEAKEKGIELREHFAHLLVHGLLHLHGFDHQDDDEAEEMEAIEVEILYDLNINNPYEE